MPWDENEYVNHHKHLTHFCPYTRQKDGGNGVQCDTYSYCSSCGWNPKVAKERKYKIRLKRMREQQNPEPEKWLLGSGEFPKMT